MPITISMAAVIQILTHGNSGKGMAPEISIVKDKNLRNTARDIHDKFYHTNSQLSNARDVNNCLDSIRYYILFYRNVHSFFFCDLPCYVLVDLAHLGLLLSKTQRHYFDCLTTCELSPVYYSTTDHEIHANAPIRNRQLNPVQYEGETVWGKNKIWC